jgi:hypothetical protein
MIRVSPATVPARKFVNVRPRVLRSKRRTPSCRSSRVTSFWIATTLTFSRRAAAVKLPSSLTHNVQAGIFCIRGVIR